jgi:ribosome maturation factor RimP
VKRSRPEDTPFWSDVEPLVSSAGYKLVELTVSRHRGGAQALCAIASSRGIGVDDCARVHQALHPRLSVLLGTQDLRLEVTSPGLDRRIKDAREFECFAGCRAALLYEGRSEYEAGIIESADSEGIVFASGGHSKRVAYDEISKARLEA